jgi:hypothetical protein
LAIDITNIYKSNQSILFVKLVLFITTTCFGPWFGLTSGSHSSIIRHINNDCLYDGVPEKGQKLEAVTNKISLKLIVIGYICKPGEGFPSTQPIFVVFTIIHYLLNISVVRPSSGGN